MIKEIRSILLEKTSANKIIDEKVIQELWSGYGKIYRLKLDTCSVILKLIKFPNSTTHPRGWNSDISHNRKVKSYIVEKNWYRNYNFELENSYSPRLIDQGEVNEYQYIILEDLKENNFQVESKINLSQIKLTLKWLANFHAKYLQSDTKGLWNIGTYWHLETRPEELEALEDSSLKKAAPLIDQRLNCAKYKTIVHGDAKLANFLYRSDKACSAVDFQYVGGGVGIKDVAYFLSSIFNEEQLSNEQDQMLNLYFKELKIALELFGHTNLAKDVEIEWRSLYNFAWCDFYRFLKGWSPGHYKINSYSSKIARKVLECI
jgi:serine/threonine protein kinase